MNESHELDLAETVKWSTCFELSSRTTTGNIHINIFEIH